MGCLMRVRRSVEATRAPEYRRKKPRERDLFLKALIPSQLKKRQTTRLLR
jgi:hypothetical protein